MGLNIWFASQRVLPKGRVLCKAWNQEKKEAFGKPGVLTYHKDEEGQPPVGETRTCRDSITWARRELSSGSKGTGIYFSRNCPKQIREKRDGRNTGMELGGRFVTNDKKKHNVTALGFERQLA